MSITFREVKRENVKLLIGIAGGTGSGKTFSALRLARGLSDGQPFAFIDTENGRAKHYADLFPEMRHGEIHAPFRPMKYLDAITEADKQFGVVVVDSASHEWAGDGGCLDWHDEIMDGKQERNMMAWIEPKREHKRFMSKLLQIDAHVVMCFRAEPKVEVVTEGGKQKIIPKRTMTGLDGWIPIAEKMQPFEMTASFLMMADHPGVPLPIKFEEQHRQMLPHFGNVVDEEMGKAFAGWALGGATPDPVVASQSEMGLTLAAFNHLASEAGITTSQMKSAAAEMYPGRKSTDLTRMELDTLWDRLKP